MQSHGIFVPIPEGKVKLLFYRCGGKGRCRFIRDLPHGQTENEAEELLEEDMALKDDRLVGIS
jgi:hypothetical protein